jgi:threonine aldolase
MRFFSDNAAPVHPKIMQAIADANVVDTAYDGDALSQRIDAAFSELFERDVAVLWVSTGTAANCLALASLAQPHQGIICHREAHIEVDECGAPGFYTGGAKLMLVEGEGAKIAPDTISALLATIRPDVHQVQAAAVSITNATEYGLVYRPEETAAIGNCAARGNWDCTWTARVLPMPYRHSAAHLPRRRGALESTSSASALPRMAG